MQDLGVLHPEPVVGYRYLRQGALEGIQDDAITAVPDGVHVDLEASLQRLYGDLADPLRPRRDQSPVWPGSSL